MILVTLKSELAVNDSRVYAAGVSNGGMLAYRLACEDSEDFAAIASLAGTTYGEGLNGTEVVLYTINGGTHEWFPPCEIPTTDLIWRFFELHPRQSG